MTDLKNYRDKDGTIVLTKKELNDTFTDMEREYLVKPLIDSGRVRIVDDDYRK